MVGHAQRFGEGVAGFLILGIIGLILAGVYKFITEIVLPHREVAMELVLGLFTLITLIYLIGATMDYFGLTEEQ